MQGMGDERVGTKRTVDVVIVGAGFAGHLHAAPAARRLGLDGAGLRGRRAASAAPGTGTAIPARAATSRAWSTPTRSPPSCSRSGSGRERYATQPEILRYANHVADRFDLRRDIQFETRVDSAHVRRGRPSRGRLRTDQRRRRHRAFVVMATGCLSSPNIPNIDGARHFEGRRYHTGRWPHEGVDFTGKRVGVIGTGSSAIQSIPVIAEQAAELTVFQRTANYTVPAHNRPLDADGAGAIKAHYAEFRAPQAGRCRPRFGSRSPSQRRVGVRGRRRARGGPRSRIAGSTAASPFLGAFNDLLIDPSANETAAEFVREQDRARSSTTRRSPSRLTPTTR